MSLEREFQLQQEIRELHQQLAAANELIRTYRAESEKARQQLAAALASCKLKDTMLEILLMYAFSNGSPLYEQAAKALAIQPDDTALKQWLGEPVARTLKRIVEEQYQPKFGMVARTYAELPKGSYPDTWQELDELYSPKGLK